MITLLCVLDGGPLDEPFPIDISDDKMIGHLKKMVKMEKESALRGIDADTLTVYKVSVPAGDTEELQLAIDRLDEKNDKLPSWESVGEVFPAPATKHIHAVIRTPESNKPHAKRNSETFPSGGIHIAKKTRAIPRHPILQGKCEKLHRLLWKKKGELRDLVFVQRTVEVPIFGMGAPTMQQEEVTELKLDGVIARLLEGNAAETPAEWEGLLPCGSNKLLFRDAYREMLHCVKSLEEQNGYLPKDPKDFKFPSRRKRFHKGLVITGQPGIGKTWFQSALLVARLLHGSKTVLQFEFEEEYGHLLFDSSGVRHLDDLDWDDEVFRDVRVWALVDQQPKGVLPSLMNHEWRLIVTSSPRYENYKTLVKKCSPLQYVMSPWTWTETVAAWFLLHQPLLEIRAYPLCSSITDHEKLHDLWEVFDRYGPIPRLALDRFTPALNHGPKMLERSILQYEKKLDSKLVDFLRSNSGVFSENSFGQNDSHAIILMQPDTKSDDTYRCVSMLSTLRFVSPWVGWRTGLLAAQQLEAQGKNLYYWLKKNPDTATSAGWIFEGRTHSIFLNGQKLLCRRLTSEDNLSGMYKAFLSGKSSSPQIRQSRADALRDSRNGPLVVDLKKCEASLGTFSSLRDLSAKLRPKSGSPDFDRTLSGVYLRPDYPNLGAVDSLLVAADGQNPPRAFFFQITIAARHPMGATQLLNLWKGLPAEVKKVPPAIILVVPHELEDRYGVQQIAGLESIPETDDGPHLWPQFVIGLGDAVLWGKGDTASM